jgi:transposase-like protein
VFPQTVVQTCIVHLIRKTFADISAARLGAAKEAA